MRPYLRDYASEDTVSERPLTTGSAAILAGVTRSAILKAVDRGLLIPTTRTESRQLLFTRADVQAYTVKRQLRRKRRAA